MLAESSPAGLVAPGAPLVGITGPRLHAAEIATTPAILRHAWVDAHYAFYPQAVVRAGGLPVHLAREADPAAIVARLDALVVAGGQDVDPRAYGSQPTTANSRLDPQRDAFEIGLIAAALERDVPLLGICRGAQLINVALGGTLVEDLRAVQGIDHTLVLYPPDARVHAVACQPGSRLHDLHGDTLEVNSFHHQGIGQLGAGIAVSGVAPDSTIEAIEVEASRWAIGVQWHPEMLPGTDPLFERLVEEATHDEARRERLERSTR
jgi:putative glutamine amidotransferase